MPVGEASPPEIEAQTGGIGVENTFDQLVGSRSPCRPGQHAGTGRRRSAAQDLEQANPTDDREPAHLHQMSRQQIGQRAGDAEAVAGEMTFEQTDRDHRGSRDPPRIQKQSDADDGHEGHYQDDRREPGTRSCGDTRSSDLRRNGRLCGSIEGSGR